MAKPSDLGYHLDEIFPHGKIGRSSQTCADRIAKLLDRHTEPLTLEDFIAFSQDRNDGPDNSLWRMGGTPDARDPGESDRFSSAYGPTEIFVRLANPGESERTIKLTLDGPFWKSMKDYF